MTEEEFQALREKFAGYQSAGGVLACHDSKPEPLSLNVYTTTDFEGHYPVGTAAVIVATSVEEARALLCAELARSGLPQKNPEDILFYLLPTDQRNVVILLDGNY